MRSGRTKVIREDTPVVPARLVSTTNDETLAAAEQIFAVTDLNVSPKWEFNFGVGVGLTGGTDHLLVKMIIGRRVSTK